MTHQHFIQRCCLEALLEEVLENSDYTPEVGKEHTAAVIELIKVHLDEAWEPTQKEEEGS